MKNLSAKLACAMLAITLGAASLTGCGQGKVIDGTAEAIVVNDESVNLGVANFMVRYQQAMMVSYYTMFGQDTSRIWDTEAEEGTYGESFKKDMLESIQKLYLLKEHAKDYDVALSEDEIAKADAAADEFIAANDESVLKSLGVTKEDISTVLQLYTYQNKMYDPMVADTDTEVSDDEAAQTSITYVRVSAQGTETDADGNTVELTDEEKAAKKDQAQQVLDQILASEDAAEADINAIAQGIDESLSASARSYGSDDTTLDEVLKTAVADLEDGEVNPEVLEGSDGYYVLRLDKTFDEEKTEQKKQEIVNQRKQERYNEILQGWFDEAKTSTTKAWDEIEVKDAEAYTLKQAASEDTNTSSSSSEDTSTTSSSQEGTDE